MTKKDQKAAEVLANKRTAFFKKVQSLTGHVFDRTKGVEIDRAFKAGRTADDFAAEIASREPVGAAIHAQKADAVRYAEEDAAATIERVRKLLAEHNNDVNACAPYPRGNSWNDSDYDRKMARYQLVSSLTTADPSKPYQGSYGRKGEAYFVVVGADQVERFLDNARRDAALQYDAFICKMVAKVGECAKAELTGSHIWAHSFLKVTKADGSTETWKTQQIVNQTKYGSPYYQWPSRKMK
jgi:hypothetical protein